MHPIHRRAVGSRETYTLKASAGRKNSLSSLDRKAATQCVCVRARGVAVGISTGIFVNDLFWDSPTQASACSCPPFSLSLRVSVCLSLSLFVPTPHIHSLWLCPVGHCLFSLPPAPSSTLRFFLPTLWSPCPFPRVGFISLSRHLFCPTPFIFRLQHTTSALLFLLP